MDILGWFYIRGLHLTNFFVLEIFGKPFIYNCETGQNENWIYRKFLINYWNDSFLQNQSD